MCGCTRGFYGRLPDGGPPRALTTCIDAPRAGHRIDRSTLSELVVALAGAIPFTQRVYQSPHRVRRTTFDNRP
jgi:hypothetical protein